MKLARGANVIADDVDDGTSHELACWLQEAGQRDAVAKSRDAAVENLPLSHEPADGLATLDGIRRPLLLGVLALAGLQYFFVAVETKILSLHSLVVFISR